MYSAFQIENHNKAVELKNLFESHVNGELSPEEIDCYQKKQLRAVLGKVMQSSEFYKEKFRPINSLELNDLDFETLKKLPFTTKEELRLAQQKVSSDPLHKAWIYYETTGTTGKPSPCPRNEIDSIHNNIALTFSYKDIFEAHGRDHIIGVMGPSELHSTGDTFEDVFRSLGYTTIKMWPRSPVVSFDRAITLIQELQLTALVCTPAVAVELVRRMQEKGINPKETSVRVIFTLGELTTKEFLRNIGLAWGSKVYNCMYASQESSIMAACDKQGFLTTIPINNHYEVIDPVSENSLDLMEGKPVTGELVITHLYCGQKPLVRYRTGDLIVAEMCENKKMKIKPVGRIKDAVNINGMTLSAYDLEKYILEDITYCLDYHVEINKPSNEDTLDVTIELSSEIESSSIDSEKLSIDLSKKLCAKTTVHIGKPGDVTKTSAMVSWKAARINDTRDEANNSDNKFGNILISSGF